MNEDTSIDLTEGSHQYIILLDKIKAAFDPSDPDHSQTSLVLAAEGQDLVLHITCILLGGLRPLKWPVQLTKCPLTSVSSHVVLPLIQTQYSRALEVADLIANLKEKDIIINRLVDKLEATGTGLENVFNAFSGKRKITRAIAEEKIKGLAPFKENEWKAQISQNDEAHEDVSALLHDVFGASGPMPSAGLQLDATGELIDWWIKLESDPIQAVKPQQRTQASKASPDQPPKVSQVSDDEDDDFQVQAMPPHITSARKKRGNTSTRIDDTSTEEDEPSIIPDSHPFPKPEEQLKIGDAERNKKSSSSALGSHLSQQNVVKGDETASESGSEAEKRLHTKKSTARLGVIGKRPQSTSSPAKPASPAPQSIHEDDDTASGSDDEMSSRDKPPVLAKEPLPQRRKGGLGRIGGKANTATTTRNATRLPSPEASSATVTTDNKPAGRKLGVIGKKKQEKQRRLDEPSTTKVEEVETEETKAERKRVELARELERKATAGPVKKKRKF